MSSSRKRYSVIYADPPWHYNDRNRSGGRELPYKTMKPHELKALPVENLAAEDALLFLWTTWPQMEVAMDLIQAWGFKYKTLGFIWVKLSAKNMPLMGQGHYTRSNTEPCLIAKRGRGTQILCHSISQVVMKPRQGPHSTKPPEVIDDISSLVGNVPKIELFARRRVPCWDRWGDEAPDGAGYVDIMKYYPYQEELPFKVEMDL